MVTENEIIRQKQLLTNFVNFAKTAASITILVGICVLLGWTFDNQIMKSVFPGLTAMNPGGTALAFVLCGLSLFAHFSHDKKKLGLGKALAVGALMIALAYFYNHYMGTDAGPDQMLFKQKLNAEAELLGHANRMAPNTAFSFVLTSLALISIDFKAMRGVWISQNLALAGFAFGLLTAIGYLYHSVSLIGIETFIPMALNTALCFALINMGIIFARPQHGIMAVLASTGAGGILLRRLLPVLLIFTPLVGWFFRWTEKHGLVSEIGAFALFVLSILIVMSMLVWRIAAQLEKHAEEQKAASIKLKEAKEIAETASRVKSEFLANMSHELRTPMNSILGMTRLMYEDVHISKDHHEMAGVVYRSADNLLEILNDLLDISKIEANQLTLEYISFSLEEVIARIMDTMIPLSSEKGITLSCYYANSEIPYLMGDPLRTGRAVMNLVSNAVKFTQQGSVNIVIDCRALDDDTVEITVEVSDTGIGIPEDKIGIIFDKFSQADESMTRRFGGTGLGLNITRQLVEMMNGSVTVESRLGEGSVFTLRIPFTTALSRPRVSKQLFQRERTASIPENDRRPIEKIKVLLAEDHMMNQAFMKKLFRHFHIETYQIFENGSQALKAFQLGGFDLVLTDCHMPEMGGFELAAAIRAYEKETGNHTPIIAMTADAMVGTREKCFAAGMDDFLTKPVNPDELELVLGRWFLLPDIKKKRERPRTIRQTSPIELSTLMDFMSDSSELENYIDLFISQSDKTLELLSQSCVANDIENWRRAAHKLKGGASMIGAEKLRRLCQHAEEIGAGLQERRIVLEKIGHAYKEAKESLAQASFQK